MDDLGILLIIKYFKVFLFLIFVIFLFFNMWYIINKLDLFLSLYIMYKNMEIDS